MGTAAAALLFGALISGTSQRNLDPTIFEPELATNLTYIIQGLVMLMVSADVLVLGLWRRGRNVVQAGAARLPPAGWRRRNGNAPAAAHAGRGRMSALAEAAAPSRVSARELGWLGIALGALAWYIALPPILLRTPRALARACARGRRARRPGGPGARTAGWATAQWPRE